MQLKQAVVELQDLATHLARLPVDGSLDLASRVLASTFRLAEMSPPETDDDLDVAQAVFLENLETLPKTGRAWWLPPHNMVINQTLLGGYNLWRYTVLPFFPKRNAYSEKLGGFIIHPSWVSINDKHYDGTKDFAEKVVAMMQKASTVQEATRAELDWIEREFSIRIPENIQGAVVKDALPTAKRRWSVDRLRIKDRLIPLDGSPPRDIGSLDFR